ncbi:hypothetical protein [Portibacter lacus]|uniref:T9SS C-terminal target domain-containing protein n=1 Tax=Portibacter lacus TaxID=1099794 RepID=A0AA37ST09_9BACT|nr:hypothetical protein [Portibacter lacus]GLR17628.1 hypothetical protein GCM10007940_22430 [Portibacter lacus]
MLRLIIILLVFLALENDATAQFLGGNKDGYHTVEFSNPISIFAGGEKDGYHTANFENSISIFSGGTSDGYASDEKLFYFIWAGTIGTGWNVGENWSTGFIPDINSRVIIPNNVPNFPAINSGVISVGEDPNAANYLCKQILIHNGAQMTLRVNAFMENYGEIQIYGSIFVLNSAMDAIQNLNGGLIQVRTGGALGLVPN